MIDLRNQLHFAAVRFCDLPDNGEAKPASTLLAAFSGVSSPEPLEDPVLIRRIDSRPLILNGHPDPWPINTAPEPDCGAFG